MKFELDLQQLSKSKTICSLEANTLEKLAAAFYNKVTQFKLPFKIKRFKNIKLKDFNFEIMKLSRQLYIKSPLSTFYYYEGYLYEFDNRISCLHFMEEVKKLIYQDYNGLIEEVETFYKDELTENNNGLKPYTREEALKILSKPSY